MSNKQSTTRRISHADGKTSNLKVRGSARMINQSLVSTIAKLAMDSSITVVPVNGKALYVNGSIAVIDTLKPAKGYEAVFKGYSHGGTRVRLSIGRGRSEDYRTEGSVPISILQDAYLN